MGDKWLNRSGSVAEILGFLLAGGLYLADRREAAIVVLVVVVVGWCIWVTVNLLRLSRRLSVLSGGQLADATQRQSQLQDMHAGWSGANQHRNIYRFRIGQSFDHIDLLCYFWTPDSSEGDIILQTKDGVKYLIGKWLGGLTPNRNFPTGLTHGSNGVTSTQESIVREAKIEAVCFDITDHVRSGGEYEVHFLYRGGSDGTWIKGIDLIVR